MDIPASVRALCDAGPIAAVHRVGMTPLDEDDDFEITFASGSVHMIGVGLTHATDIEVHPRPSLIHHFGHLRVEEPQTWAPIARDWVREEIALPWLKGATLANPRRLAMTQPYRVEVGWAFDAGGRQLAIFGEADLLFLAALDDASIASFELAIA